MLDDETSSANVQRDVAKIYITSFQRRPVCVLCGAQKVSAGVCSLSVDAVPVTGGCCAADNTQPSPADFRSIFQIVIKRTAATSNKCVTVKIIIIVKCKIVHYRL